MSSPNRCPNMNHGRLQVPIRFCPECGEVINSSMRKPCNETDHVKRRKNGDHFCIDCGAEINK